MTFNELKDIFKDRYEQQIVPAHLYCLHKTENNHDSLIINKEDMKCKCTLCGHEFNVIEDHDIECITKSCIDELIRVLDTIKVIIDTTDINAVELLSDAVCAIDDLIISMDKLNNVAMKMLNESTPPMMQVDPSTSTKKS